VATPLPFSRYGAERRTSGIVLSRLEERSSLGLREHMNCDRERFVEDSLMAYHEGEGVDARAIVDYFYERGPL
jgi:hypothetical protein